MDAAHRAELVACLDGIDLAAQSHIVCVGAAGGGWPEVIRERDDSVGVIVYEPRPEAGVASSDGVTVCGDMVQLREALFYAAREMPEISHERVLVSASWDGLGALVPDVEREWVRQSTLSKRTYSAAGAMQRPWAEHVLRSLHRYAGVPLANTMAGAARGVPGVVVGAGPSLDRNIDTLAAFGHRAIVVACNTSYRAVQMADLDPHLLVVAEGRDVTGHLKGCDTSRTVVMPGIHSHPSTWDIDASRQLPTMTGEGPFARWLIRALGCGTLGIGGSVTTLAASVLQHLGCDPIILVGQDCALSLETGTHARTSAYHSATCDWVEDDDGTPIAIRPIVDPGNRQGPVRPLSVFRVPGWGGGEVYTTEALSAFSQWFEQSARAWDARLINCTEGGAHIDGWAPARLAATLGELPDRGRDELRARMQALVDVTPVVSAELLSSAVDAQLSGVAEAQRLARDAMRLNRELREVVTAIEALEDVDILDSWVYRDMREIRDDTPVHRALAEVLGRFEEGGASVSAALREAREAIHGR